MRHRRPPMFRVLRPIEWLDSTANPSVVLVRFVGGRRARLRRDLIDIYPGTVGLPKWLDKRIFKEMGEKTYEKSRVDGTGAD